MFKEVVEAQKRYKEQFGENYPIMGMHDTSTENILKEIDKCIRSNEQFKPDIPEGAII